MEVADTMIDTLSTARRLEHEFGMDPRAAEGVATAIYEHTTDHLVTKADLQLAVSELRQESKETADGLRQEIRDTAEGLRLEAKKTADGLRQEIRDTAGVPRQEAKETTDGLRQEIRDTADGLRYHTVAAVAELRAEMHAEFKSLYRHLWLMFTAFAGVIVTLTKLLP